MVAPMDFTTTTGGRLVGASIHRSLHPGDPTSGWSVINLRNLQWIDPAGLVALAVFAEAQADIGRPPYLYGPEDLSRARYLSRMHVGEVITDLGGVHDLPQTTEWDQEGKLLELQRFDGRQAAEALGRLVHERIDDPHLAHAMHASICEIGINVPEHSGRDHGYIAAVTTYRASRMSFAVGDAGVGVLEPLLPLGFGAHSEVLRALLEVGVTRTGQAGRGRGIISTRGLVNARGGQVFMASGAASVVAWPSVVSPTEHATDLQGTILHAEMPCSR